MVARRGNAFAVDPHGKVDLTPEDFYDLTQPDLVHLAEALGA
jgi:hypothetical protein